MMRVFTSEPIYDINIGKNRRRGVDKMAKTMRMTISIEDENGKKIISKTEERIVPYIEEIEEQGFRSAFHDLETAILESRKEVCDSTVSEYLEVMSKKKQEQTPV
jgi:predicted RNase H-like nuclease